MSTIITLKVSLAPAKSPICCDPEVYGSITVVCDARIIIIIVITTIIFIILCSPELWKLRQYYGGMWCMNTAVVPGSEVNW